MDALEAKLELHTLCTVPEIAVYVFVWYVKLGWRGMGLIPRSHAIWGGFWDVIQYISTAPSAWASFAGVWERLHGGPPEYGGLGDWRICPRIDFAITVHLLT